jgi:hypothetical protein
MDAHHADLIFYMRDYGVPAIYLAELRRFSPSSSKLFDNLLQGQTYTLFKSL